MLVDELKLTRRRDGAILTIDRPAEPGAIG